MEGKTGSALKRFLGHFSLGKSKKDGGGKDDRVIGSGSSTPPAARRQLSKSHPHPEPKSSQPPPDPQATAEGDKDNDEELPRWRAPRGGGPAARTPIDGLGGHEFKDCRDVMDKVLGLNEDEAADEEMLRLLCAEQLRKATAKRAERANNDGALAAVRAAFEFSKFLSNDDAETKRLCQAQFLHAIEANDKASALAYDESASADRHRTALYYSTVA